MPIMVHLSAEDQPGLIAELEETAGELGLNPTHPARLRAGPLPVEVIVALGSAGAFTALFQLVSSFLSKNKDRELTISIPSEGKTLTMKGHSLSEEKDMLRLLASTFDGQERKKTALPAEREPERDDTT